MTKQESKIFEMILIEAVKERPYLYNSKHPKNKDLETKANAWKEIAKLCGEQTTANRCLSRWKSLRDRYVREFKICSNLEKRSKWIYYNKLEFLQQHLQIKDKNYKLEIQKNCENNKIFTMSDENVFEADEIKIENNDTLNFLESQILEVSSPSENINPDKIENLLQESNSYSSDADEIKEQESGYVENNNENTENNTLDEPEIDFNFIKNAPKSDNTSKISRFFRPAIEMAIPTQKLDENENFGLFVSETIMNLPYETRIKAKSHLIQFLSELHVTELQLAKI